MGCGAPAVPTAPEFGQEVVFADHREVDVRLPAGDVALAGTLYLPIGEGRFPLVVYVHGSGRETRMPFLDTQTGRLTYSAKPWVDHGMAVFSYDKRGSGASGGACCPFREPGYFPLLASDALAAVAALAHHAAIDRSRMGLYGLSQGGWVAPNAAVRSTEIAFVVIVSGPAVTLGEEEYFSSLTGECPSPSGLSLDEVYARMPSAQASGFDPRPDLARLSQPAFFVQGLADRSQPARSTLANLEKMRAAGGKAWQIAVFPHADHILFEDRPPCQFGGHEVDWLAPLFAWTGQVLGPAGSA